MTNKISRVFIGTAAHDYTPTIQEGLEWIRLRSLIKWGDSVFIKPNLTFPVYRKGVMTSPDCVEALVIALKDYTDRITVGESDTGGYNRFQMDGVLRRTGIKDLERKYGIHVVNLTHLPARTIDIPQNGCALRVPLPIVLLDETNLFVSAPVPKIHMYTGMSGAVKNLWGCIPNPESRMRFHPSLATVLFEIIKRLPRTLAIVDGMYGLNGCGPMQGDAVTLNWLLLADNLYAADVACCHLMQIDPNRIQHLRYAVREHALPNINEIDFSQDWQQFVKAKFYLKRQWTDYPGLLAFRSHLLAYIAYYSPAATLLHKILNHFRQPFYNYEDPQATSAEVDPAAIDKQPEA
jgi:uncharacterized protein (DUF362 family)